MFFQECRGSLSSTLCSTWACGEGSLDLQATGSFACVGGTWADVLPMCLGSTYPGSPGGPEVILWNILECSLFFLNRLDDLNPTNLEYLDP